MLLKVSFLGDNFVVLQSLDFNIKINKAIHALEGPGVSMG